MAEIVPTIEAIATGVLRIAWGPMGAGDTGSWVALSRFSDKTVTVEGTIATFAFEGSNDPAGANPRTLLDVDGTTLINVAGHYAIKSNPLLIRPNLTAGSAVTVSVVAR
jgi:hypothetical protein